MFHRLKRLEVQRNNLDNLNIDVSTYVCFCDVILFKFNCVAFVAHRPEPPPLNQNYIYFFKRPGLPFSITFLKFCLHVFAAPWACLFESDSDELLSLECASQWCLFLFYSEPRNRNSSETLAEFFFRNRKCWFLFFNKKINRHLCKYEFFFRT